MLHFFSNLVAEFHLTSQVAKRVKLSILKLFCAAKSTTNSFKLCDSDGGKGEKLYDEKVKLDYPS